MGNREELSRSALADRVVIEGLCWFYSGFIEICFSPDRPYSQLGNLEAGTSQMDMGMGRTKGPLKTTMYMSISHSLPRKRIGSTYSMNIVFLYNATHAPRARKKRQL